MNEAEMESLLSLAVERAGAAGADAAEAVFSRSTGLEIRVFRKGVETFQREDSAGLGLRVLAEGREGYAYTERLDAEAVAEAAAMALENASVSAPDDTAAIEAHPEPPEAPPMFNPALAEVPLKEKVALALAMEEEAFSADGRIENVPYAGYGEGEGVFAVANSEGVYRSARGNYAAVYCMALAREGESLQTGYMARVSRDFEELRRSGAGREAGERAAALLGAEPVPTCSCPVVFENRVFASLLGAFSGLFSARAVQEGRSVLAGRLGERIAGEGVSILDDALRADGPSSRPFDSEGVPSAPLAVVENGVLRSFLHNTRTARRAGVRSTGHAARSYSSPLGVSPSNFFLPGGEVSLSDALSGPERVFFVVEVEGLHSGVRQVNGDFSLGAKGFWYENGRRVCPVQGVTVSGNFLEALGNVAVRADDFAFNPPGRACFGAPSVLVEGISVAGK